MSTNESELTIEQARARLGDVVSRADRTGQITYVTHGGRRIAAIVPLERIEGEADISIILTSVDLIAEETGATAERVRAAIEHVRSLPVGQSLVTRDDVDLLSVDGPALDAIHEQLGRVVRFVRAREDGEQDTVTFTITGLEITETSTINGTTRTRTDTGADLRDIDAYLNERAMELMAEGYSEALPAIRGDW